MDDRIIVYLYNDEIAWSDIFPNFHYPKKYLIKHVEGNDILTYNNLISLVQFFRINFITPEVMEYLNG